MAKKKELGFWVPFLCWRFSERVGFGRESNRASQTMLERAGGSASMLSSVNAVEQT